MPAHVVVRPATAGDAGAIVGLLVGGSMTPAVEDPTTPQAYAAAIERIRAHGGDVLVAADGEEVVGVCQVLALEHLQHQGGSVAELESVHVDASRRSEGIGSLLLAAAVEWATSRGCYRVQLTSNAVRHDAHRFYEANGFEPTHVGFKRPLGAGAGTSGEVVTTRPASRRGPATHARLTPLADDARSDEQRQLLSRVDAGGPIGQSNIFTTLVRAPELFRRWLGFGGALLGGTLPARDRELLILRTAVNCVAPYEWGQHVRIGRAAGLTDVEIERVAAGPAADGWDDADRALLAAADELHARQSLADDRFAALAARYDEVQLIELLMVVGHYHLVAMALNALGVEPDDGLAPLGRA